MQKYVKVRIEATKAEIVVTEEYYNKYPGDMIHLGPYPEPKKVVKVASKPKVVKTEE